MLTLQVIFPEAKSHEGLSKWLGYGQLWKFVQTYPLSFGQVPKWSSQACLFEEDRIENYLKNMPETQQTQYIKVQIKWIVAKKLREPNREYFLGQGAFSIVVHCQQLQYIQTSETLPWATWLWMRMLENSTCSRGGNKWPGNLTLSWSNGPTLVCGRRGRIFHSLHLQVVGEVNFGSISCWLSHTPAIL